MKFRIIQRERDGRYYIETEEKFLFWKCWRLYDRAIYGYTNPLSGFMNLSSAEHFVKDAVARNATESAEDKKRGFTVIKEIES